MTTPTTVRSLQGDTVDLVVYRHYGKTRGLVEPVLDANPGLAGLGAILPLGTVLTLPVEEPEQDTTKFVRLWD